MRCAIEAIAEVGYQRASLAEIAKRARVSKSVISYHFAGGKDALIRQVFAAVYETGGAFMVTRMAGQTSARAALRAYIDGNTAFMREHRTDVKALVEIIFNYRDENGMSGLDVTKFEPAISDLEVLLRNGQKAGEFRAFDTTVMAFAIRSAIDSLPARLHAFPDIDIDRYGAELADLFDRATALETR